MHAIWRLDPLTYERHPLHDGDRAWPESNCYVDVWIELLHAARLEPLAALPCTFGIDLEGDQWTFFKFPLSDLYALYGIEVIELNVWRPLVDHLRDQLALGRPSIVEVDAFYLPDTAGTSYHAAHVKTSIAVQALDAGQRRLGYFHNAGYYELDGDDFQRIFRVELNGEAGAADHLPPYVEVAKLSARAPLEGRALVTASRDLLRHHLTRRPQTNPFRRYAQRFPSDIETLAAGDLARFHGYAFSTLRQCGAAFELAGAYLRWLAAQGEPGLDQLAVDCDDIAINAKALQFKTARSVGAGRPFDPLPTIETMAARWDQTLAGLDTRYGTLAHQG